MAWTRPQMITVSLSLFLVLYVQFNYLAEIFISWSTILKSGTKQIISRDLLKDSEYTHWINFSKCSNTSIAPELMHKDWCLDTDQVPRYIGGMKRTEGLPAVVPHYNHDGYERCLANKTVVFIGDSRVRYQFMHLVSFLGSKRQMRCGDFYKTNNQSSVMADKECFLINEKMRYNKAEWTWNDWYKDTTTMLGKDDDQESLCDCHRSQKAYEAVENRFIERKTKYGNLRLVFLQNYRNSIKIDKDFPPFSPFVSHSLERCAPGTCSPDNRNDAFSGNLPLTLWTILPLLNASHAFVSLGWSHLFGFEQEKEFSCTIKEFEEHHPHIKVDLISHVPHRGNQKDVFDTKQLKCPIGVLDRFISSNNVPPFWYWDNMHVLGILNEEYNHQLVERVCPLNSF